MTEARAAILTGYGINCEEELDAAFRLAGAAVDRVHSATLLRGHSDLAGYDIVALPGGFSFGDDLGAGRVLAHRIRSRQLPDGSTILEQLIDFAKRGGFILGICNGFQTLVALGLLPNTEGSYRQEASLAANLSGRFEDRWVQLAADDRAPHPAVSGLGSFEVPVRHGEGRLVFRDRRVREAVIEGHLSCLSYVDAAGAPTDAYPENPNGAELACAGLCDPQGRVLGLMPHPEAYLSAINHYDWPRRRRENPSMPDEGEGLNLFRRLVDAAGAMRADSGKEEA